ncbi:hypothetical protein [Rubrobacter marinus]|uniref:hypothetical protein n=1 Tax=Rubrobacter marinus TaxID=2653852 RepID=UPI00140C23A3|nr:hypothetical protein [Rubrobacter marinus]
MPRRATASVERSSGRPEKADPSGERLLKVGAAMAAFATVAAVSVALAIALGTKNPGGVDALIEPKARDAPAPPVIAEPRSDEGPPPPRSSSRRDRRPSAGEARRRIGGRAPPAGHRRSRLPPNPRAKRPPTARRSPRTNSPRRTDPATTPLDATRRSP